MKVFASLLIVGLICWGSELQFRTIPNLQEEITVLQNSEFSNEVLEEELKNKSEELNIALDRIKELESATVKQESPLVIPQNSGPTVEDLKVQKAQALASFQQQLIQIDSYIEKGNNLKVQKMNEKAPFKEGNIRTSDADRKKWEDERQAQLDFYDRELDKLNLQKEALKRSWHSFEAELDLKIQQANKL